MDCRGVGIIHTQPGTRSTGQSCSLRDELYATAVADALFIAELFIILHSCTKNPSPFKLKNKRKQFQIKSIHRTAKLISNRLHKRRTEIIATYKIMLRSGAEAYCNVVLNCRKRTKNLQDCILSPSKTAGSINDYNRCKDIRSIPVPELRFPVEPKTLLHFLQIREVDG